VTLSQLETLTKDNTNLAKQLLTPRTIEKLEALKKSLKTECNGVKIDKSDKLLTQKQKELNILNDLLERYKKISTLENAK
jgi:short-subunit dehydrogenase